MNDVRHDKQMEDMVELDDNTLSVREIEGIANSMNTRDYFEKKYKGSLYSLILLSLTHESFRENDARLLFGNIIRHMQFLKTSLGRHVGISVASLDYLQNIAHKLFNPKIIEDHKSHFVTTSVTNDELTGLYLRDVFNVVLQKQVEEGKRTEFKMCLLMIDIDDFKKVNDTHGHQSGDHVLSEIGAMIRSSVRGMDLPARYGGEEMVIIMPEITTEEAYEAAERIRRNIAQLSIDHISVTVSIGIGQTSVEINTPEKLIEASDKALYQAKVSGKNQVVIYENRKKE